MFMLHPKINLDLFCRLQNYHYLCSGIIKKLTICQTKKEQRNGLSSSKMSEEQKNFLSGIRDLYIEARYREIKEATARKLNRENTAVILETTKQLHTWILERIKEKSSTR